VITEVHGRNQNALASFESGYVLAYAYDFACDVASQDVRQLYAGQSFAHPDIKVVHGAGFHAYQNLIFARLRIRNVFVAEHFGPAKFVNADGFHESPLFSVFDRAEAKSTTIRFPIWKSALRV
jgi:hypothetical protein